MTTTTYKVTDTYYNQTATFSTREEAEAWAAEMTELKLKDGYFRRDEAEDAIEIEQL